MTRPKGIVQAFEFRFRRCAICGTSEYVSSSVPRKKDRCDDCTIMGYTAIWNPFHQAGLPEMSEVEVLDRERKLRWYENKKKKLASKGGASRGQK